MRFTMDGYRAFRMNPGCKARARYFEDWIKRYSNDTRCIEVVHGVVFIEESRTGWRMVPGVTVRELENVVPERFRF